MKKAVSGDLKSGLIICAWCRKYLGTMRGAVGVSHGICVDCKAGELARFRAVSRR